MLLGNLTILLALLGCESFWPADRDKLWLFLHDRGLTLLKKRVQRRIALVPNMWIAYLDCWCFIHDLWLERVCGACDAIQVAERVE